MLEAEQQKVAGLRKQLMDQQMKQESQLVTATVTQIPGVSPAAVIELMSGKVIELTSEVNRTKVELRNAQSQINSLQRERHQAQQQQQQAGSATTTATTSGNANNRSSSPLLRSTSPKSTSRVRFQDSYAGKSRTDGLNMADPLDAVEADEDMLIENATGDEPFHLTIDGETTPARVRNIA